MSPAFSIGFIRLGLAAGLLLLVASFDANAQTPPCGSATAPACDGACTAGTQCQLNLGICECVPTTTPCGGATAPECYGECPPTDACVDVAGTCVCQVTPTLSEWGILLFSALGLGFVHRRSRRRTV